MLAYAVVVVAGTSSATAYEMTLYAAYPLSFWLAILGALLIGQLLALRAALGRAGGAGGTHGLSLIVGAVAILYFLPTVRYHLYVPGKGDVLTFIGLLRALVDTYQIAPTNYYPGPHLSVAVLSYATGQTVSDLVNIVPGILSLFYIAAVYYLFSELLARRAAVLVAMSLAALPLFGFEHVMFSPSLYAFFLVPFALLVFFNVRSEQTRYGYGVLLVATVVAFAFFHPIVSMVLVGLYLLTYLPSVRSRWVADPGDWRYLPGFEVATAVFVLFFSWYFSYDRIVGSTSLAIQRALGGGRGGTNFPPTKTVYGQSPPAFVDLLQSGIYEFSIAAPVLGAAGLCLGYLLLRHWRDGHPVEAPLVFLGTIFVGSAAAALFASVVNVTVGFTRLFRYALLTAPAVIAVAVVTLFERGSRHNRRTVLVGVIAVIVVLSYMSVFTLYGSPPGSEINGQIAPTETSGMWWVFAHRNPNLSIDDLGTKQDRFYEFFHGGELGPSIRERGRLPPVGLRYWNETVQAREDPPKTGRRYLLVTELGIRRFPAHYPSYRDSWPYRPADIQQLNRQPKAARIYDNGEFWAYLVDAPTNISTTENAIHVDQQAALTQN